MIEILPINAFQDNYIWVIKKQDKVVIVDPGDAAPILHYIKSQHLRLSAILITHHHDDHIGGVKALLNYQQVPVYAPSYGHYVFEHNAVSDQDTIDIPELNISFDVIWLPGHTQDHIAYRHQQHVFCGDIIFGAGCGRIFNGSLAMQFASLNKIKQLPDDTLLYCAHEYTQHNIDFALTIEPDNHKLIERQKQVAKLRTSNQATVPLRLKTEIETNPFLRCNLRQVTAKHPNFPQDPFAFFSHIRGLRNHY